MSNEILKEVAAAAARLIAGLQEGASPPGGSLTVIGTGIRAVTQLTIESLAAMATAEELLHVIGEPIQEEALLAINPKARTMTGFYADGLVRNATYEAMVREMLSCVAAGKRTVAAFYGHPEYSPTRRTRPSAVPAPPVTRPACFPAVSAEDCLFADLGRTPVTDASPHEPPAS